MDEECIKALARGASRYHVASLQDRNPIIAARHNGYAVALIDALAGTSTEEEVQRAAGLSLKRLRREILEVQDRIEDAAMKIYRGLVGRGIKIPGLEAGEAIR